jgi:HK97 family phage prohead protease
MSATMTTKNTPLCRAAKFEIRSTSDDGRTLEGYAAVFNTPTRIDSWEGKFDEELSRGAFSKTIDERTPVLQFDHGRDVATGSVPIGSIEALREDDHGLFVRARLHQNDRVEPIRQAIESGAIDGMSFRFRVVREEWDESGDVPMRTIREVELFELGPVVFPAYESTSVGVRSLLADLSTDQRDHLLTELLGQRENDPDPAPSTDTQDEPETDAARTSTSEHRQTLREAEAFLLDV